MQSSNKRIIVVSVVVISALIAGYFAYETYGIPQTIQNEASKIINNATSTIHQITPLLANLSSSQSKSFPLTNQDNRVPIAVYDDCSSTIRNDLKEIYTICSEKDFLFIIPSEIEQNLQPSEAILGVSTKVYQYGTNDFTIWLSDQMGGKNYTVNLSQLPTSSGLNLPTFKYGASENFIPSTNILTTNVRSTIIPLSYLVVIKDWNGIVMRNETFTLTESNGLDVQTFDLTGIHKPASLTILVDGKVIYTAYVGSPFT